LKATNYARRFRRVETSSYEGEGEGGDMVNWKGEQLVDELRSLEDS
jgi:hypothetical protein